MKTPTSELIRSRVMNAQSSSDVRLSVLKASLDECEKTHDQEGAARLRNQIAELKRVRPTLHANSNLSDFIEEGELDLLVDEVAEKYQDVLQSMLIDTENDHNTKGTARRVAKMFIHEVFAGRYVEAPKITSFPNVTNLDEIYTLGPIEVKSACSHHMVPIVGHCWIGIKPTDQVIGISKFHRLVKWVMKRPHIQEEAVQILADEIEKLVKPEGLAIVIKATHMCMTWRGVEAPADSTMVTSVVRGSMRKIPSQKQEFFNIIEAQGFKR